MIELFWPAATLAVLLVYIHALFGIEIIKRGVIFTDLAIGQLGAVGMALSITFLEGEHQAALTFVFAVGGALLIAWATHKIANIEAFIGLLYAFGISGIMLILAKSAEGVELFSKLSAADILFTSPEDLWRSVAVYLPVSLVMFFMYPRLKGLLKELVFFVMLAVTVTSSVASGGVLVVFALLIAPAYVGVLQSRFPTLLVAWFVGVCAVLAALWLSYMYDMPTGYMMVFVLVCVALVAAVSLKGEEISQE